MREPCSFRKHRFSPRSAPGPVPPEHPIAVVRLRSGIVILLAALLLPAALATAGKRKLDPNPANDPALIGQKMDPNRYDPARRCKSKVPKGTRKLKRWMKRNTKRGVGSGIIRCERLGSGMSVHSDGRALDWGLDARRKREKRVAMRVIRTWMADDARGRDNALARRMGVQMVIYNCRIWQAGDRRMSGYGACGGSRKGVNPTAAHIDHMHIELTKPASRLRTSFWQTELEGGGGGVDSGGVGPG